MIQPQIVRRRRVLDHHHCHGHGHARLVFAQRSGTDADLIAVGWGEDPSYQSLGCGRGLKRLELEVKAFQYDLWPIR